MKSDQNIVGLVSAMGRFCVHQHRTGWLKAPKKEFDGDHEVSKS